MKKGFFFFCLFRVVFAAFEASRLGAKTASFWPQARVENAHYVSTGIHHFHCRIYEGISTLVLPVDDLRFPSWKWQRESRDSATGRAKAQGDRTSKTIGRAATLPCLERTQKRGKNVVRPTTSQSGSIHLPSTFSLSFFLLFRQFWSANAPSPCLTYWQTMFSRLRAFGLILALGLISAQLVSAQDPSVSIPGVIDVSK